MSVEKRILTPRSVIEGSEVATPTLSSYVEDLLRDVPQIELPNIFPQEWHGDPEGALSILYQRSKDEARHMAICLELLKMPYPKLSDEEKILITKQLRAGFVFLSMILYEPVGDFWNLPPYFLQAHQELERLAREAGLGVATFDVKQAVWKNAMLKVKKVMDSYGIEFPAMPEVGITGKEVTVSMEDDIIPVF